MKWKQEEKILTSSVKLVFISAKEVQLQLLNFRKGKLSESLKGQEGSSKNKDAGCLFAWAKLY